MSLFAPYAAAEIARLKKRTAATAPVIDVTPESFAQAEERFTKCLAGIQHLGDLLSHAAALGARGRLPADMLWPRGKELRRRFTFSELKLIGETMCDRWADTYMIDVGALVHRLELGCVSSLVPGLLHLVGRRPRQEAEGRGVIDGLQMHYPEFWKRLQGQEWWCASDSLQVAAVAAHRLLREVGPELPKDGREPIWWGNRNIRRVLEGLASAPVVVWRAASEQVKAEAAFESRLQLRCPNVDLRDTTWPSGRRRARLKGPVSIALDGMGLFVPDEPWVKIAARLIDGLSESKGPEVVAWSSAQFGELVAATCGKYAVLSGLIKSIAPEYGSHIAKSVISAYVRDQRHLTAAASKRQPSPVTSSILFWSAISRGWQIVGELAPDLLRSKATNYTLLSA